MTSNQCTIRTGVRLFLLLAFAGYFNFALAHGEGHAETADKPTYEATSSGTRTLTAGPVTIKMLADMSNLGVSDIEVGELFLPAGFGDSGAHAHGSLELFYVVSGVLGHSVNGGPMQRLEPGMLGFVKPGDTVNHAVLSDEAVRTLVIWVPGGEADRLIKHAGFSVSD